MHYLHGDVFSMASDNFRDVADIVLCTCVTGRLEGTQVGAMVYMFYLMFVQTAIDSAISMNDPAVLVDVVNILNLKT